MIKFYLNRNSTAWFLLVIAIAIHVFDETMSDFLSFYNPTVLALREQLGFFPFPTFSYEVWLGGLIAGLVLILAVTPLVARSGRIMKYITAVFGILMILNSLIHLLGSLYSGKIIPGTLSSPLLLAVSLWVVHRAVRGEWGINPEPD